MRNRTAPRRRLLSAGLAFVAGASLVGSANPALAAGSSTFGSGAPADGAHITRGETMTFTLRSTAPSGERVTRFTAVLDSVGGTVSPAYSMTVDRVLADPPTAYDHTMRWNPNAERRADAGAPATDANGTYRIRVTTETCNWLPLVGCDTVLASERMTTSASRTYVVNIPPRTPTGVKATMNTSPVVSWARNPEPDIVEYRISRSDSGPGGKFGYVGTASRTATSWTDKCTGCPPGGTVAYKVAAVRRSPVNNAGCEQCIVSAASASSAGVAIPAPPAASPGAPGSTPAAMPSNPQSIPAADVKPLPQVVAPTKQIVAPQTRSDRYAPTLPYAAPLPQDGETPVEAPAQGETVGGQAQVLAETVRDSEDVPKVRFIAGAILLLVAAMHLARGGGMLLRGSKEGAAADEGAGGHRPRRA